VLLDDPLEYGRITLCVPGSFRVDDGDGTILTDPQTVRFRAVDPPGFGKPQFSQPALEIIPGLERPLLVTAFGLGLIAAKEDMPAGRRDSHGFSDGPQPLVKVF
jgi:hypothetical protein